MSFRAAVLSVLLPLAAVPAAARDGGSLSIELVAPATILLSGPIDERSSQRLEEVVAGREVGAALVMLDSPGGLLVEGMALGRTIRRLGYSTAVPRGGVCHSACVF